jgi:hypothetical protein
MQFLDDFEKRNCMSRDIVQFVKLSDYEHDKAALTHATLEEIPNQLVDFFYKRGIMPQASSMASTSDIVVEDYNNAVDIDLHVNFGIDNEVTLYGDQSAAHIDNRYEAGIGGMQVLPPTSVTQGLTPVSRQSRNDEIKDPAEASSHLTLEKYDRANLTKQWSFNNNTMPWLLRNMYDPDKVEKTTFAALVDFVVAGGEGTRRHVVADAKRRARRYKE